MHQSDLLTLSTHTTANTTSLALSLHTLNDALSALTEVVTNEDMGLARQTSDTAQALTEQSQTLSTLANDTNAGDNPPESCTNIYPLPS